MLPASRKNFLKFTEIVDMSSIRIPTSFNIDLEFEIPEFHRRLLAWLIDSAVIILYWIAAYRILAGVMQNGSGGGPNGHDTWSLAEIAGIPSLLYYLVSEIWTNGQSVGKKIMRIRVINMNGGKPSLNQYVIRWLLRIVDFSLTLGAGAFFSVIFSRYSQRLGDLAAGTILISTNARISLDETIFMETAQDYVPRFPQVMQLSDRDLNTIRSLLQRARGSDNFDIAATASEKVKTVLRIESPMEPFEFLETLLMDYNHISVQ
jgi:uncharacterized RDD family membrane protein YckC